MNSTRNFSKEDFGMCYADDCVIAVSSSANATRVIGNDLTMLTSYCRPRSEWVARRTCLAQAISKDILSRKGLVSCLDYYLIIHSLKTN